MSEITYEQMALAALKWGDKPLSTNNVRSMVIWACSENDFVSTKTKAQWNPWDTTEPEKGANNFNSVGVKNYDSIQQGLTAFWATLNNGFYPKIILDLDASAPAAVTCNDIINSPWGSKPTSALQGMVLANWEYYATLQVGGSVPPPPNGPIYVQLEKVKDAIVAEVATAIAQTVAFSTIADSLITHAHEIVDLANQLKES